MKNLLAEKVELVDISIFGQVSTLVQLFQVIS